LEVFKADATASLFLIFDHLQDALLLLATLLEEKPGDVFERDVATVKKDSQ